MTQVFDASAVLAALFMEPGGDKVAELWADGGVNLISTVNMAEIVTKLNERGMSEVELQIVIEGVPLTQVDLDPLTAYAAGLLRTSTRSLGLSLGDRVCLALGRSRQATVVTAERLWARLDDFDLVQIR